MIMRHFFALTTSVLLFLSLPPDGAHADGDVLAFVTNGTLYVVGDKEANNIIIKRWGGTSVRVQGIATGQDGDPPPDDWKATSINGDISADFQAVSNIVVSTGNGDDRVYLNFSLDDVVTIQECDIATGAGSDRVEPSGLFGNLSINTGAQDDHIDIFYTTVAGNIQIEASAGNDSVWFALSSIGGVTAINTGQGNDDVLLGYTDFGDLLVGLAAGADRLRVVTNAGAPRVAGHALLFGGAGKDVIYNRDSLLVEGILEILEFEIFYEL